MTAECFMICWNREDTIHLSIKYYQQFCSRIVIFDNYSTDLTRDIALELGCDVRLFGTKGVLNDQDYLDIKNHAWKSSQADWVIVCDDDEILYHPDLEFHLNLAKERGHTIFKTQGYSMYAELVPRGRWLEVTAGTEDDNYSKTVIFNPKAIKEINYIYGCHQTKKQEGFLSVHPETLMLLHYKYVGGVERLINRHHEYEPRRQKSAINMRWNLGHEYSESDDHKRKQWHELSKKSRILF